MTGPRCERVGSRRRTLSGRSGSGTNTWKRVRRARGGVGAGWMTVDYERAGFGLDILGAGSSGNLVDSFGTGGR